MDALCDREGGGISMMTPSEFHDLHIRAVDELHDNGIKDPTLDQIIAKMKCIGKRGAQRFEALFGSLKR
jgi:hypothetical protein